MLAGEDVGVGLVVQEVAEDRREPALCRIDRLGIVLGDLFSEAEVDVRIDQAGKYVQARRGLHGHPFGDRFPGREQGGDASVANQNVHGRRRMLGTYDNAAA